MKTQISQIPASSSLSDFQKARIKNGQLSQIKGGDGDTPPEDGVIGVEEIVGM